MLKRGYCYNQCLLDIAWTRVKGNDNMISCAKVISVSASYSRCSILAWFSLFYDLFDLCTMNNFLMLFIYIQCRGTSVFFTFYHLIHSYSYLKSLPKCNLSSKSKGHNKHVGLIESICTLE